MKNNFNDCLNRVLKDEGGYTNDPSDSGGATKYGITIADVKLYVKKNATSEDVRSLSLDQAKSIYKAKYWDAVSADSLPAGVDYACFDYAVNSGVGRAKKVLQKFSNKKGNDLIDAICDERTAFLKGLASSRPKDQKFLKGWLNRVSRVRKYSHYLAAHSGDKVSGPTSTVASGITIWATLNQYIHNHPYIVIGSAVAAAVVIGTLIHLYRNRK